MTGTLKYFLDNEDEPGHTILLLQFENDYHLVYDCTRKLGAINILESIEDYIEEKGLGPDALDLNFESFKRKINNRRSMAKSFFMNQKILSGVGNIYSDEILFQSKIHPRTKVNNLGDKKIMELYNKMQKVLEKSPDYVKDGSYPDKFLMTHRSEEENCPVCGEQIKKIKISSRSSYFCPNCQKEIK
ncbi:MAG: hypothetical protein GF329_13105 [Candidatus Lokiarchaeota archaeon]|nr:hypothetical protein [Candidatus Lokiarchaeota archaeon]